MEVSDATEKILSHTTGDRSREAYTNTNLKFPNEHESNKVTEELRNSLYGLFLCSS
jgi:hypothetical protein